MIVDVGPARAEWLRAIREAAGEDAFGQLENLARCCAATGWRWSTRRRPEAAWPRSSTGWCAC